MVNASPLQTRSVRNTASVVITCPHDVIDTTDGFAPAAVAGMQSPTIATTVNTTSLRIATPFSPRSSVPDRSSTTNLKPN